MANLDVKKRSEGSEQRGLTRRSAENFPSLFGPSLFGKPFGELANPFALMRRMTDEMDRMLGNAAGFSSGEGTGWVPALEITEKDGKLIVSADLPGLKKEDVKVEVTEDALIIEGERKRETEEEGRGFRRSERSYGRFYRAIPLPEGAETDQAKAQFRDGELEITIPLVESKRKGRQIPIEAGSTNR